MRLSKLVFLAFAALAISSADARQVCANQFDLNGNVVKRICREVSISVPPRVCPDCVRYEEDPKEVKSVRKNIDGSVTVQRADQTEERWSKFGDTWYKD